jgi:hypothetical protein
MIISDDGAADAGAIQTSKGMMMTSARINFNFICKYPKYCPCNLRPLTRVVLMGSTQSAAYRNPFERYIIIIF